MEVGNFCPTEQDARRPLFEAPLRNSARRGALGRRGRKARDSTEQGTRCPLPNAPVVRSSSPGNRRLASRLQVRAKLEGRSWWRLPSGLWHASIFPENRPGQSEVRANTRAKEGVLRGDGRGCRRGNVVPHNAPAFPCPEGASLSRRKQLSRSRPRALLPDTPNRLWRSSF